MALEAEILPQVKYQRRNSDQNHWVTEVPLGTKHSEDAVFGEPL